MILLLNLFNIILVIATWYLLYGTIDRKERANAVAMDGDVGESSRFFSPDSFRISIVLSVIFIHHYPSSSIIHNVNLHYRLTTEHIWWFPLSASIHRSSISQCCLSYASEILLTCHYCQIVILVRDIVIVVVVVRLFFNCHLLHYA